MGEGGLHYGPRRLRAEFLIYEFVIPLSILFVEAPLGVLPLGLSFLVVVSEAPQVVGSVEFLGVEARPVVVHFAALVVRLDSRI